MITGTFWLRQYLTKLIPSVWYLKNGYFSTRNDNSSIWASGHLCWQLMKLQSLFQLLSTRMENLYTTHPVPARPPITNSPSQSTRLRMVSTSTVSVPATLYLHAGLKWNISLLHALRANSRAVCERITRAHKERISRGSSFSCTIQ
jgi:hypothetical protein